MSNLKCVHKNSTIGLICPSSGEDSQKINNSINFLNSLGFKIKTGNHIYKRNGYLAGTDIERAEDLMDMFKDSSIDMILCVRGGYGAMRLLPYINFDIIKENPKIFMGFSDITVLLNTIYFKCGFPTFHGPMGTSNLNDKITFESFINTISNTKNKSYILKNPPNIDIKCLNEGKTNGILIGGNLCLICSTLGTPYEIDTENKILFLEDIGEAPYKIDRMLTQLLLSNKLEKCKGIILGSFTNCDLKNYNRSFTLEEVFKSRLSRLNIPILMNLSSGHCCPTLTLPIGSKISLDTFNKHIKILDNPII